MLAAGADYGRSSVGAGTPVICEYVSANPTGPMHVGHCRGAVFGDALANLLEAAGFAVTREYYVNDAGAQVDVLARSAYLCYREALGEEIQIPEGLYPGDISSRSAPRSQPSTGPRLNLPEAGWLPLVRERAIAMMMVAIRADLAALNVRHDVFFSERSLIEGEHNLVAATIAELRRQGYVYEGRLPPPKGAPVEDGGPRADLVSRHPVRRRRRSSADEIGWSLHYFASDIAYHKSKFDRGFRSLIDVWGADHGGYVKRMRAAVQAVSADQAELDVKIVQLVKLLRAGQPVKMSKRSGEL